MFRTAVPTRLAALVAALPLALVVHSRAAAQAPALEVFYRELSPKEQFKYTWKGQEATANAGVLRWEVPESAFGTDGLDHNFTGYCAEVLVPIVADKSYRFRRNSIFEPANYGLTAERNGPLAAERRARYIQELFGRFYRDPAGKATAVSAEEAVAFQVALWELIQETEPAEGEAKRDLFAGDFRANYPKADAPAFVTRAQTYLDALTGNDALYYENPDLRGRELVRLMGVQNAEGVVAQSQFALRYSGGGGVDPVGGGVAVGGGGGVVGGGFGAPVGGVGGFGGGGGGFTTGNGGGTITPSTSTLTPTDGSSVISPPPPTVTTNVPPVGGPNDPEDPTNPVPAPPAVLLGVIALGTLGSWRLGVRYLTAK